MPLDRKNPKKVKRRIKASDIGTQKERDIVEGVAAPLVTTEVGNAGSTMEKLNKEINQFNQRGLVMGRKKKKQ